ncbi:MAG: signal peptide peptidase SppA [Planctomycetes bacterium]|nr:signal peptide peptidase SppA [Planctomycetota bacterium]
MRCEIRAVAVAAGLALLVAGPAGGQIMSTGEGKLAYFELHGPVLEKPVDPMATLFGSTKAISLKDLLERFKKARDDASVKAVILDLEGASMGLAQVQEVRQAIAKIRAVDKDVYVHADSLNNLTYALGCAASHVSMVPTGDLWLTGLYAEQPYVKGLLDKMSVTADIVHIGDYKSAGEFLYRTGPSEAAEENINWLLDGLYEALVGMISESRQVSADKARALIDDGPYTAERALAAGLIDSIQHRQDFADDLGQRYASAKIVKGYGKDDGLELPDNIFAVLGFVKELIQGGSQKGSEPSIAVVYVDGIISLGSEEISPFGSSSGAKSTSIRKALDEAAKDESVKAVVLRVDSPGGSATASEIIWNATQRVKAEKPLIVSMGNVAGSGGYYVACGADAIFADEATITASIGVVGGKLVTTEGWNRLGINWKEYKRGQSSGIMSSAAAFSDDERQRIMSWMDEVYTVFKGHITEGRGTKLTKPLEEMAGGRVFTGKQALELGLIDRLGGLDDAVRFAAAQAKISDYEVRVIPKARNFIEMLMEDLIGGVDDEQDITIRFKPALFSADSPLLGTVLPILNRLDPVRVQALLRCLQRLEMIHQEGIITMMPAELIIR